jgi:hypothetical protein
MSWKQELFSLGEYVANATFLDTPYRFVGLNSNSKLVLSGAGGAGLGVIQDEPAANQPGNVMVLGVSKLKLGGTVAFLDSLASDATGKGVAVSSSDQDIRAIALEAGVNGDIISVLLISNEIQTTGQVSITVPALGTDVEATYAAFKAPYDLTIIGASFIPVANITGAATNHRKVELLNKGLAGAGATVMADLAFDNGINAVAFDEKPITLSATPANRDAVAGDVMAWYSSTPGTGIADPGGLVTITFKRR